VSRIPAPSRPTALRYSNAAAALSARLIRYRSRVEQSSLARRVLSRRLLVLAVAITVGWQVTSQLNAAQRAQYSWGNSTAVIMAARPLKAGELIDSASVRVEQIPTRFLPDGALVELPLNSRVRIAVSKGEILLRGRVSAVGAGALSATLTTQTQAVTLSLGEAPAPVQVGDIVDVISVSTASTRLGYNSLQGDEIETERVATAAQVIQVTQGQATLAVRREQVDALVRAASTVPISLVILS
jgi:Flp pilus assembly protein CpaB